jgi:hypothetical protein
MAVSVLALGGCASEEKPASNNDQPATSGGSQSGDTSGQAALPNPMVAVDGPEAFLEQLGLRLEPDPQGKNPEFFIISSDADKIAQINYDLDVDGKTVQVEVRAQKTTTATDISGIYDKFSLIEPGSALGDVVTTLSLNEGAEGYVYWYNQPAGISGTASVNSGATADLLDSLSHYYIQQENLR